MGRINYKIEMMKGRTFSKVEVNKDNTMVSFTEPNGIIWNMAHNQDWCESVYLEDTTGDLKDLEGAEVVEAYSSSSNADDDDLSNAIKQLEIGEYFDIAPIDGYYSDSYTWTFYRIATTKGTVTFRWYGESNGYYSEDVDIWNNEN